MYQSCRKENVESILDVSNYSKNLQKVLKFTCLELGNKMFETSSLGAEGFSLHSLR